MRLNQMKSVAHALAITILIIGLSGCDQLLRILPDDRITADTDVPQFENLSGDILVGVVFATFGVVATRCRRANVQRSSTGT